MIRLKDLLRETTGHGSPPIDGKSKTNASNWVHGKIRKYTTGFFADEYWNPIQKVFKEFDNLGLNWHSTGARYEEERVTLGDKSSVSVPIRKRWTFEIKFLNNRDKDDTLYGNIVASGSGPVESPLDRYDVTITVS